MFGRRDFSRALMVAALFTLLGLAPASAVLVSESIEIHNSDEFFRNATDFHYTFSMPEWEMEDFWFEDILITMDPPMGDPALTPIFNNSGHVWKYRVDYYGLDIPFCTVIRINIRAQLNAWNVLVKEDIFWTFDTPPYEVAATPSHMFQFPMEAEIVCTPIDHDSWYEFINFDPIAPINIGDLRFYREDNWCEPWDWNCVDMGTPILELPGFTMLMPGESIHVPLPGLPNTPGYIFVAGMMEYQMPGMGWEMLPFRDGHEEEIPDIPQEGCILPDNGMGTVDFPPECPEGYLGPMMIIDGLPPGSTIDIDARWFNFINVDRMPGGPLGGEMQSFQATLEMQMHGTGDFEGYERSIEMPVDCQTATGPRELGAPVQTFPTELMFMAGEIYGDPDFDQLRVMAGSELGLPSPGSTTLTELPSGDFAVDSFFDITYQIEFVGAPGGPLDGLAGITTGNERFQAGEEATDAPESAASVIHLGQCYPNPFNPKTEISFTLNEGAAVQLAIFSADGRKQRTLVEGWASEGFHQVEFDGHDETGKRLASGVYYYRLKSGDVEETKSMILLK